MSGVCPIRAAAEVGVTEQAVDYQISQGNLRVTSILGWRVVFKAEVEAWKQRRIDKAKTV